MKSKIHPQKDAQVQMDVTIDSDAFMSHKKAVLDTLRKDIEMKGFRKGHVPDDRITAHVGNMHVLEMMAQRAISSAYPKLLEEHKIDAIGRPEISITKIAENADLECTITTSVMPEVKLPDYKKIAKKVLENKEEVSVTDEELDEAVLHLRKMRAHSEKMSNLAEGAEAPKLADITEEDLAELNDDFVKTLGDFENVAQFTDALRANLLHEKKQKQHEKSRLTLIEAILEEAHIEIPDMIVAYEQDKMMSEFSHELTLAGMSLDAYLEQLGKTQEELRETWKDEAKKRASIQFALDRIAKEESLSPNPEVLQAELAKLKERYKDMKDFSEERALAYLAQSMTNQLVFAFLENDTEFLTKNKRAQ